MALRLNGSTSGYVGIDAPATAASNTLVLPNGNGSNGQALTTNGSGTLSWTSITGSQWTTTGSDIYYTAGKVLVGTSSVFSTANVGTNYQLAIEQSGASSYASAQLRSNNSDTIGAYLGFCKSRGTTAGSNTIVQSGDTIGEIAFEGADGSALRRAASISCYVDATPGASDMPGRLVFSTTADGASSPTERMRITNDGFLKASSTGGYYSSSPYHEFRTNANQSIVYCTSTQTSGNVYGIQLYFSGQAPNNTTSHFLNCDDNVALRAAIRSNGGLANYQANNVNLSDINAKKDISPAADTWNCIKEWEIVNYRYKDQPDDADLNLGVIAQQVAESCPEVITVFSEAKEAKPAVLDNDGNEVEAAQEAQPEKLGIKEQQMYWMAIKALQEAMERIETLEAANASLEARLTALEVTP